MPLALSYGLVAAAILIWAILAWRLTVYRRSLEKYREWLRDTDTASATARVKASRIEVDLDYLRSYVFPDGMLERAVTRCPRKTSVEDLEEGLRQYLAAAGIALVKGLGAGMPSQTVDEAWHEFMIYTRSYAEFCDRAYGRFMHHEPEVTMTTTGVTENQTAAMARTWDGACQYAGIAAHLDYEVPVLFELDAKSGVKGAKQYVADCGSSVSCEAGKKVCVKHALRQTPFQVTAPTSPPRASSSSRSTSSGSSASRSSSSPSSSSSSSGMDATMVALLASDTGSAGSCGSSSSSSSCGSSSSSSSCGSSSSSCGSSSSSCGSSSSSCGSS